MLSNEFLGKHWSSWMIIQGISIRQENKSLVKLNNLFKGLWLVDGARILTLTTWHYGPNSPPLQDTAFHQESFFFFLKGKWFLSLFEVWPQGSVYIVNYRWCGYTGLNIVQQQRAELQPITSHVCVSQTGVATSWVVSACHFLFSDYKCNLPIMWWDRESLNLHTDNLHV